MLSGRKKSRFSIIDPIKRRKRTFIHIFRIFQVIVSSIVTVLFYLIPPEHRNDVVVETCYPSVFMLVFFRVLTTPTAKISFYYNLYVDTIGVGLYSVVGTNDLYNGLINNPKPQNEYIHYARLYLMLTACFLLISDVLYIEFFEKNPIILPGKMSVGDALRAKIEISLQKYKEDLAKREEEEMERERLEKEKEDKEKEEREKLEQEKNERDKESSEKKASQESPAKKESKKEKKLREQNEQLEKEKAEQDNLLNSEKLKGKEKKKDKIEKERLENEQGREKAEKEEREKVELEKQKPEKSEHDNKVTDSESPKKKETKKERKEREKREKLDKDKPE